MALYKFIPFCVVRGIQLAQGLSFALTAVKYVRKIQDLPKSKSLGNRGWFGSWKLNSSHIESISSGYFRGVASVCWDRAGYGSKGYEQQRGFLCNANLHSSFKK
ncbi:hypothetical protein K1719_034770 [Acacia pycnantha]|nr:hypothetical protein K1719_034770 [Acacia pycnantha]